MSDEWCTIFENTQDLFERVSRVQGWLNESTVHCKEYCVAFFKQKCCFYAHQCSVWSCLSVCDGFFFFLSFIELKSSIT